MKAIMESNAGKTMEMIKKIKIVTTRIAIFMMPLKYADLPTIGGDSAIVC